MTIWRKSTRSLTNGNCVEVGWRKSTRSGWEQCVEVGWHSSSRCDSGACVEVAGCSCGTDVLVRDSKDPDGPVLSFDARSWLSFIDGVKNREFDYS